MYLTDYNERLFKQAGVDKYHKHTKGKGVTIALLDGGHYPKYYDNYEFESPLSTPDKKRESVHAGKTLAVGRIIVPEARIIVLSGHRPESFDWIAEHADEIDIINVSMASVNKKDYDEKYNKIKDLGIPIVSSSGNKCSTSDELPYPAAYDYSIAVGAATRNDTHEYYSNQGLLLDVLGYSEVDVLHNNGSIGSYGGTSCASPFVAYSLALFISYLKQNNKQLPTREELKTIIHENAKDVYEEGFDKMSGYGVFRMPKLENLLEKYPDKGEIPKETPIEDEKGDMSEMNYEDVKKENWFYEAVKYVNDKDIMTGVSDTEFSPNTPVTRAQLATVIQRLGL